MTAFVRLELDPEWIDEPFVVDCEGALGEEHCEACGTTWFDPLPGPIAVDVEAPLDGIETLAPGAMPGSTSPLLVVHEETAHTLSTALGSGTVHPVSIRALDSVPLDPEAQAALGRWAALWPQGHCKTAFDPEDGATVDPCAACGRFEGEFVQPWSLGLDTTGWDGSPLFQVPGWRYSLFATEKAWATIQSQGVRFLRAQSVPSREG